MSDRPSGQAPSRLVAVLGPTNTGKTHLAVERMLAHASGMIGLPLRLLAREVYDRIVKLRGARAVALVTGEEKIVPPRPHYWVCTVEAMPLSLPVEFLAIDEIQLCADPERGHVFTDRLLHARGSAETMLLGAGTMAPLIRRLLPDAEIQTRERFSTLRYTGSKKLTRLPRRTAIVAFSADQVYAIAELIRRQRGGAAVVMGNLSPRTRNAQVALYQSGEVDFLVATDAIGMGLNMDVDHVAFSGLRKFDGKRMRWLYPHEIGQIAGRAGRYKRDGTFGVTGDCEDMDDDLVEAVENHAFQPVVAAEWRNARLDFSSLVNLQRSLTAPPQRDGLKLSDQSLDEIVLNTLAKDDEVRERVRNKAHLLRLWEVCQTPDFRKLSLDEHLRLVRTVFEHLTGSGGRVPDEWIASQYAWLDRTDGEIDALSGRLANVRTLAYAANRSDWLSDPRRWQDKTRELEERISDALHEKLMQRFIDRRTSALMRSLNVQEEVLAGVSGEGDVTVEGQFVGRLKGLAFDPAKGASQLEDRALRAAAQRAVGPEVARRLGKLAAEPDEAFGVQPDGIVLWRGEAAGRVDNDRPFAPKVKLFGELGPAPARERAARRLEAYLAAASGRKLIALKRLEAAVADGKLRGLARGIAWRMAEAGGVLARSEVESDVKALSVAERRMLKALGVRFGAFSLFLPAMLTAEARDFSAAFSGERGWRPPINLVSPLPEPSPAPKALAFRGLRAVGRLAVPVEALERLDALMRAAPRQAGGSPVSDQALQELGWSAADAGAVLRALGFTPTARPKPDEPVNWRRRQVRDDGPADITQSPASPFAALAALKEPPRTAARRSRRPRRRRTKPAATA
jgi:ATP-dependent RNA helicase SUPV3L1/SUV3